jgi:hypothetical protein
MKEKIIFMFCAIISVIFFCLYVSGELTRSDIVFSVGGGIVISLCIFFGLYIGILQIVNLFYKNKNNK